MAGVGGRGLVGAGGGQHRPARLDTNPSQPQRHPPHPTSPPSPHPVPAPGIGRPSPSFPVASFVLQNFSDAERADVDGAVRAGADAVRAILALGVERAVSGVRL